MGVTLGTKSVNNVAIPSYSGTKVPFKVWKMPYELQVKGLNKISKTNYMDATIIPRLRFKLTTTATLSYNAGTNPDLLKIDT